MGAAPLILPFPLGGGDAVFGTVLGPFSTVESVSGFLQAVLVLMLLRAVDGQTTAALGDYKGSTTGSMLILSFKKLQHLSGIVLKIESGKRDSKTFIC